MSVECSVCCEYFNSENTETTSTSCGHIFHDACIAEWLKSSSTCPQCRQPTKQTDLRRLFLSINVDIITPCNTMSKLKEKERAISVLRALNHDLISESEKNETKLRDELKQQLENVSRLKNELEKVKGEKDTALKDVQTKVFNLKNTVNEQLTQMLACVANGSPPSSTGILSPSETLKVCSATPSTSGLTFDGATEIRKETLPGINLTTSNTRFPSKPSNIFDPKPFSFSFGSSRTGANEKKSETLLVTNRTTSNDTPSTSTTASLEFPKFGQMPPSLMFKGELRKMDD